MSSSTVIRLDHRLPSLDGLRGIAILLVVVSHLSGAPGVFTLPGGWGDHFGSTGVRIFFVLSGFLITTLLLQEHAKTGAIHLTRFYIRRIFRIFPAFYLYLLVLALAGAMRWITLLPGDLTKAALYLVDYFRWDSTSNFVRHIWSLSVEEQFYLIWPVALVAFGLRKGRTLVFLSVVLTPLWRLIVFQFLPQATLTIDRRFDCVSDTLATGCLLAFWNSTLMESPWYRRIIASRWIHLLPVLIFAAVAVKPHPHIYYGAADTALNVAIAIYMHRTVLYPPWFLNNVLASQIGFMSYSIYLWQQVFCSGHEGLERLPAYLALLFTFACAAASYYLVELPLHGLGRRLASGIREPVSAASLAS